MQPIWQRVDSPGRGRNPSLDGDDTSGDGPENIVLQTPEIGVPYTIAVSHFERAAGRTARVVANCGTSAVALDVSSRPFRGSETGACSRNDFWTVATLTFTSPVDCVVDTIDTYRTSQAACASFE